MPVRTTKSGSSYRVIEANSGKVATNKEGTPVDGGGHETKDKADAQVAAINMSLQKEGKIPGKPRHHLMGRNKRTRGK